MRRIAIAFALVGCFVVGTAVGKDVQLTAVATGFNNPIGIDHHPFSGKLILSVNFPSGLPYNFELVGPDGVHAPFSGISGLTEARAVVAPKRRVSSDTLMTGSLTLEPPIVALFLVSSTG